MGAFLEGGNDRLYGGAGDDTISGSDGRNTIFAGAVDDLVRGGDGSDTLEGWIGADTVQGGRGNDVIGPFAPTILGPDGGDQFLGGRGRDTFIFAMASNSPADAPDRIADFERGKDRIDLQGVVAGALAFVGAAGFTGPFRVRAVEGRVELNLAGDLAPEMVILVPGAGLLGPDGFAL